MKKEQDEINKNLKIIARTSIMILIVLVLSKLVTYIYRIIIGRYFGPEEFGIFSLALSVFGLISMFSSFGLTDGLLRFVSIYRGKNEINKINYVYRVVLIILFISSMVSAALLFFGSTWISIKIFHNYDLIIYLRIFSVLLPINAIGSVFLYLLTSYEKANWQSFLVNMIQNTVKILTLLLFIFIGLKSSAIIFSYFLGAFTVAVLAYIICKYKLPEVFLKRHLDKKQSLKIAHDLFSYSWPITFLGFFTMILYWTDSFVLGYFKSATEVGFYNAVTTTLAIFALSPEIFSQILFPLMNKAYSKKKFKLVEEISKQVAKWILIINLPLFLIAIVFPGTILNIIWGEQYLAAINVLRILSIASLFININVSSNLLLMKGKSKIIMLDTVFIALFNLVFDILLVKKYGMNGAAFATLVSSTLLGIIFIFQAKKYANIIPLRRKMFRILLISIIPLLSIIALKNFIPINLASLILLGVLFFCIYFLLIYLTGCLDSNDLYILDIVKKKIINVTSTAGIKLTLESQ